MDSNIIIPLMKLLISTWKFGMIPHPVTDEISRRTSINFETVYINYSKKFLCVILIFKVYFEAAKPKQMIF